MLLVWLAASLFAGWAQGATVVAPEHHPWARFRPGAWKLVRVVTETLDEQGRVSSTSITETKTTLLKVEQDGAVLEVRVTVEVAGKRFEVEPQVIKQGFHGELVCPELKVKETTPGQVTVEGRKIPCQIVAIECSSASSKTATNVYYSKSVPPFVLKRESVTAGLDGSDVQNETAAETMALDMPFRVMSETYATALTRTVQKLPKGTTTTWANTTTDVPGGVISHSSKEVDADGRLVRRSTLELVDYGLEPQERRPGLFGRIRSGPLLPLRPKPR